MTRQYYCWKVCLTFRCGCTEYTPTAHRCGPSREGCNRWLTYKRTDKACEEHRLLEGWGLNDNNNNSSSSNNNSGGRQVEGGRGRGESGYAQRSVGAREVLVRGEGEEERQGRLSREAIGESRSQGERGFWEGYFAHRPA